MEGSQARETSIDVTGLDGRQVGLDGLVGEFLCVSEVGTPLHKWHW